MMEGAMSQWLSIQYRDFWDVPRMVLVHHRGSDYLLDCLFDETTEDYPDYYQVYLMPALGEADLNGPWIGLPSKAIKELGRIPVASVRFDPTKRRELDVTALEKLLQSGETPSVTLCNQFPQSSPAVPGTA
jgi:hypothetical protein